MDLQAIAVALAAKYSALTPPSGEPAIRESTADLPEGIGRTPTVLVAAAIGDQATFDYGAGERIAKIPFEVTFFLEKATDLKRQVARLQKWAPVLLDAPLSGVHLGLAPPVAGSWTRSFELGDVDYGGQSWAAVSLIVDVQLSEGISPTA